MHDPRHAQPLGARPLGTPTAGHPQASHHPHIAAMPVQPVVHEELEPIGLDDDVLLDGNASTSSDPLVANAAAIAKGGSKKITAFGVSAQGAHPTHDWKRTPHSSGTGICRVRTFHGRLSDQGLEFIDTAINEWLDAHPEIDVKAVTTNTSMFDGKVKELTLIINVWY